MMSSMRNERWGGAQSLYTATSEWYSCSAEICSIIKYAIQSLRSQWKDGALLGMKDYLRRKKERITSDKRTRKNITNEWSVHDQWSDYCTMRPSADCERAKLHSQMRKCDQIECIVHRADCVRVSVIVLKLIVRQTRKTQFFFLSLNIEKRRYANDDGCALGLNSAQKNLAYDSFWFQWISLCLHSIW